MGVLLLIFDGRNPAKKVEYGINILCESEYSIITYRDLFYVCFNWSAKFLPSTVLLLLKGPQVEKDEGTKRLGLVLPSRTGFIQNAFGNRVLWYLHMVCDFSPSLAMGMSTQIVGS